MTSTKLQTYRENGGVSLTWKDLSVKEVKEKEKGRAILKGITGYALPGELLAIMGPSGSGKSTLLDALAGRLNSNTRQAGEILINGRKETLAFGTSAYVTQDDALMTTLTVREAITYSAMLQLPDAMPASEKKRRAETTIREMGLQDCIDTRIGGSWSAAKGLSGGQKRRVSICIEILMRPKLLFLDEPTSGLDSAASYHVMKRIAHLARPEGMTVIASIHQPAAEVFQLFHNLSLLCSGTTLYFGPASLAQQFFASAGFPCPPQRNPSDHYLRTVNKDFDEQDSTTAAEENIEILVKSYQSSEISQQTEQQVAGICQLGRASRRRTVQKGSQASFVTQCSVLTRRSFVNMYRDLGYYWLRFAIYLGLCFCVGTVFYDVGHDFGSIQARGSMLLFVAAFLTFMTIGGFPSFVEDMKIFGRERLNGHYEVGSFVLSHALSSIPYLIIVSLIPGAVAYLLVGLQRTPQHFAFFTTLLFLCMLLVESLMMIVASIVPNYLMGIMTGAGIQGLMILSAGFFRLPHDLPNWFWKYPMYHVAFHKYANQGFYKNEFVGLEFPRTNNAGEGAGLVPTTIDGEEILRYVWEMETGYSKWVDLGVLTGMVVVYRAVFWGVLKFGEKIKPILRGGGSAKRATTVDVDACSDGENAV
ncbi:unnamed protein product [Linum tenue]|uniref:ABC transporter domain-containing protein n=1 Tax=Linum tenue TaxID=586396 RepID=A0AAV0KN11_9ROSI|nr:unnamed protein product [Linum tenue]